MLILTRRIGEAIHIIDDIRVVILDINGGHVRLGIEAPKEIPIHREEIYKRIQAEKDASSEDQHDKEANA